MKSNLDFHIKFFVVLLELLTTATLFRSKTKRQGNTAFRYQLVN